jgi:hypothetical protein
MDGMAMTAFTLLMVMIAPGGREGWLVRWATMTRAAAWQVRNTPFRLTATCGWQQCKTHTAPSCTEPLHCHVMYLLL